MFDNEVIYCVYEIPVLQPDKKSYSGVNSFKKFDEACKLYLELKEQNKNKNTILLVKETITREILTTFENGKRPSCILKSF